MQLKADTNCPVIWTVLLKEMTVGSLYSQCQYVLTKKERMGEVVNGNVASVQEILTFCVQIKCHTGWGNIIVCMFYESFIKNSVYFCNFLRYLFNWWEHQSFISKPFVSSICLSTPKWWLFYFFLCFAHERVLIAILFSKNTNAHHFHWSILHFFPLLFYPMLNTTLQAIFY